VPDTEQTVCSTGRKESFTERYVTETERQVSREERSKCGASAKVLNAERSEFSIGHEASGTEQSGQGVEMPSVEREAIRGRDETQGVEYGAIRTQNRA